MVVNHMHVVGQGLRSISSPPHEFDISTPRKSEPSTAFPCGGSGSARLVVDTGLDADGREAVTPATEGSGGGAAQEGRGHSLSPPHTQATSGRGVRQIATWLATTASSGSNRRVKLHQEYQQLLREHRAEQVSSEEIQSRLSLEMRELRDQCHEQGQTVGLLTHRLADAAEAVTAELRAAMIVRTALGGELMSEESQRRALEAAHSKQEAEAELRVEASEKQLAVMSNVQGLLKAQLHSSMLMQAELREHIAAERDGCSELEMAGERELVAYGKAQSELASQLQVEREEVETRRSATSQEVTHYKQESEQHDQEEKTILERLNTVREAQDEVRAQLQTETAICNAEVEELRERMHELDEECWQCRDSAQRYRTAVGACGCERAELEEEVEQAAAMGLAGAAEVAGLEERSAGLMEELQEIRESMDKCHENNECVQLCRERDSLIDNFRQEVTMRGIFESELESLKRSRGILCWRRRPPAHGHVPLPPPQGPPPSVALQPQCSPEYGRGTGPGTKGGGGQVGPGGAGTMGTGSSGGQATGSPGGLRDEV